MTRSTADSHDRKPVIRPNAPGRRLPMATAFEAIHWIAYGDWPSVRISYDSVDYYFPGGREAYCAAERELVAALANEQLVARVCDLIQHPRGQTILTPPDRSTWHDLPSQFWADHAGQVGIHPWGAVGGRPAASDAERTPPYHGRHYGAASFRRVELLRIWPQAGSENFHPISARALTDWYRAYVAQQVAAGTRPRNEEIELAIRSAFPNHQPLTQRRLRDLKASRLTPKSWKIAGKHKE